MLLQCSADDMQFALCKLNYMVLQYGTVTCNLHCASCIIRYGSMEQLICKFHSASYIIWYRSMEQVTCNLHHASYIIRYCSMEMVTWNLFCARYIVLYCTMEWWLAICTMLVTLYGIAVWNGDLQFALCKLHYMVLPYGKVNCNLHCGSRIIWYCSRERRLAIWTVQATLYGTATWNGELQFALCKLHYTVLPYGTGDLQFPLFKLYNTVLLYGKIDLQFALCKLHYTVLRYRTGDFPLTLSQVRYALLHCSTDDLQFTLWKLYYAALLCHTVIFWNKTINFLCLFGHDFRHFFYFNCVAVKY